jgi:hypothetical protein
MCKPEACSISTLRDAAPRVVETWHGRKKDEGSHPFPPLAASPPLTDRAHEPGSAANNTYSVLINAVILRPIAQ